MDKINYLKKINSWDIDSARHILSRAIYGYTKADIDFALSFSLDDFVDKHLLKDLPEPNPPKYNDSEWVNLPYNSSDSNLTNYRYSLIWWWLDLMLNQGYSLREKMVWFFSNHFVTEFNVVQIPQYFYISNQLFRKYAFGNIIELTKKVTIDPAMLIYLNGNLSTKTAPNENYARELFELFTLGIGNYTEEDIKQAAKALTGWRVDNTKLTSYFTNSRWDTGSKTIFNKTGNWNNDDVINLIFTEKSTPASEFICRKLYKEFIYYLPNEEYVKQLATLMRNNNFNLKPVLSSLFKSQYFHSQEIRGAKIKSPIEFLISLIRYFNIKYDNDLLNLIRTKSKELEQEILNPPDVRGWEGQRRWINTTSYPARNIFSDSIINGIKINNKTYKVDVLTYARSYPSSENAVEFINDITKVLFQYPLSQKRKDYLLTSLLDGTAVQNWSTYNTGASSRLSKFLIELMRLPEFQLS
ncbi:MAG: DUF1800 domain-containing protein [Melioribacteraceae bacterium]|nr:DUF1800 domain-containing protein [Melioribacteraceae bacterium]